MFDTERLGLRPYQRRAVAMVLDALKRGRNVVLSMPTGSGKTLVALIAALKYSGGGGVSVFTRTLSEYQAWEREARRLGVAFSGHVGRDRVCKYGPKTTLEGLEEEVLENTRGFRPLIRCNECAQNLVGSALGRRGLRLAEGDWHTLLAGRLGRELEEMQRVGVEAWVMRWRDREEGCGYPFARDAPTPIKLYTHLTYFLLWRHVGSPTSIYVFDEAHNLAGITRKLTFTLKYRAVAKVLAQYQDLKRFAEGLGVGRRLAGQVEQIERVVDFLSELALFARWERERPPKPPEALFEGDERLQRLAAHLGLVLERPEVWRLRRRILCGKPACGMENPEGEALCTYCGSKLDRDTPENRCVRLVPVDPSFLLERLRGDRWIMLSGSMPAGWYLESVLGLSNFEVVELNPFEKSITYYLDEELDMSYHNRGRVKEKAVSKVLALTAKTGVTLVVTQNYEEVEWFRGHAHLLETPNTTIGEVSELVERRCARGLPTLVVGVARGKLFEGVEFKHAGKSAVSRVILLGVPYPNTQDEDFREMAKHLEAKRGVKLWELLLEEAVMASKQAIGRAIRGPEDTAKVYFLDKRFKRLFKRLGVESYAEV